MNPTPRRLSVARQCSAVAVSVTRAARRMPTWATGLTLAAVVAAGVVAGGSLGRRSESARAQHTGAWMQTLSTPVFITTDAGKTMYRAVGENELCMKAAPPIFPRAPDLYWIFPDGTLVNDAQIVDINYFFEELSRPLPPKVSLAALEAQYCDHHPQFIVLTPLHPSKSAARSVPHDP